MTVEQLQEKMTAIIAKSDAENRSLTDDEVTEYEGLEKSLAAVRKDGELRKRHAAYQAPANATAPVETADKDDSEELDRAFESYLRTGQRNADLIELRAQGTTDASGGYMIPDGFRQKLTERMKRFGGIANVAETFTTESGNPINWPTVDDTGNEGEIVAEHATGAAGADITFGTKTLGAFKYMSFGASNLPLRVSVELLQDAAFDVSAFVARALGKRIARAQAGDLSTGGGTSAPEGLMTGTAAVTLATGGAITYAKLLDVVHAVDPDYRETARWVFNDTTLKTVRLVLDGNNRPLFTDANSEPTANSVGSLLGYPVTIDQSVASIGDATKVAAFGDIEEAYVIRRVQDVTLVVDPYSRAANGEVEFTAWARMDAGIQNANAYAILASFDEA